MQFKYPERDDRYIIIHQKQELRQYLQEQAIRLSIPFQFYKIAVNRDQYMYAKCTKCQACLKYKRDSIDNVYRLHYFKNQHKHKLKKDENQFIIAYLRELPQTMKVSSQMNLTVKTFGISKYKFYYLYNRMIKKTSFDDLLRVLNQKKCQSRMMPFPVPSGSLPDIFIVSTPQMIKNFEKYGHCCSFDLTYNLIKEFKIVEDKKRNWGLGLFLGKNNNFKTIPFAICCMIREKKQDFKVVFKTFFQMMNKQPSVIITDQQSSILGALRELQQEDSWSGTHLLDTFHMLRNMNKKCRNKQFLKILHDSVFQSSPTKFIKRIEYAAMEASTEEENQLIQNLLKYRSMFCLSQLPNVPYGLSVSTSYHEKANDLVKQQIQYEKPATYVILKTLKIMEDFQKESVKYKTCTVPIQEFICPSYQIKSLKQVTCEIVFRQICKNYVSSLPLLVTQNGQGWEVQDKYDKYCVKLNSDSHLQCQCGHFVKTGLPCQHLHKIIEILDFSILDYISEQWKLTYEIEESKSKTHFVRIGRPKNSRKNR